MINFNKAILIGRLTKDIDLRKTQNNVSVCRFTLAINRPKRKDQEEETDFINCVAWNHSADFLASYATKGTIVCVLGSIQTGSYENQQGQKVYTTEINAIDVQIINMTINKPEEKEPDPAPVYAEQKATSDPAVLIEQEELPFY